MVIDYFSLKKPSFSWGDYLVREGESTYGQKRVWLVGCQGPT